MKLTRYGIVLETMTADHLEMVRLWRNQDYIREKMQFQELLERSDQQHWFESLDPQTNLYWIIRYNDYPIGLVHIKDVDTELAQGEAGIFIGEPSFLKMPQAMLAILFMMELAFYAFGLKQLQAKIHHLNHKAIRFNCDLGYELSPDQQEGFQYYSVTKTGFERSTEILRDCSISLYGDSTTFDDLHPNSFWDNYLKSLSHETKTYFNL